MDGVRAQAIKTVLAAYGLIKAADAPQTNAHNDVGTYRFNHGAQGADIQDSLALVFRAHDRKPDPAATGDESGQVTFLEGVSG
jgi:hypothetical protein